MFCDCDFTSHCQVGHQSRDCPEPRNERGGRAGGGGFGGQDQEAYSSFGDKRGGGGGGGGGRECYNCGKVGHQVLLVISLVHTKDLGITWSITKQDKESDLFMAVDTSFAMRKLTRRSYFGYTTSLNHDLVS